jgi:hypothetical protein
MEAATFLFALSENLARDANEMKTGVAGDAKIIFSCNSRSAPLNFPSLPSKNSLRFFDFR